MARGGCRGQNTKMVLLITTIVSSRVAVTRLPNEAIQADGIARRR